MASLVRTVARQAAQALRARDPRPAPPRSRARWSPERARAWADATPWLLGANFVPSTTSNQLEMWQADTFDLPTIDRELGWAAEQFGMNSMRIFLHDLAWSVDGPAFLDRVDAVLAAAAAHGITVMPVLFDGIWDPQPRTGPQREPRPRVHNSRWLQSPGAAVLADPARWDGLRPYVDGVLGRFGADPRVVAWDLFNEPDSPNPAYLRLDPPDKPDLVTRLLDRVFDWAVAADPDQPLTVGVFNGTKRGAARNRPLARLVVERSDVISFHCYEGRRGLEATIEHLAAFGRPLVCTEWLGRPRSPAALLEVLAAHEVGAYSWGLVAGRSQTVWPWTSWWWRRGEEPDPWFHDLLHRDGTPYDPDEAALFRRVAAGQRPAG